MKIAILPGDGIGPEVTAEAVAVIESLGLPGLTLFTGDVGGAAWHRHGHPLPEETLAMARAAGQFLLNGRIVSGGSTITMQLARLMEPREERSLTAKLRQALRAIQIERRLDKREILARYLTVAPYGGNLEGVRAASLAWFGKEPKRLTLAEAALHDPIDRLLDQARA